MPFYVGDYLRDTRRLSLSEHGAYLLLIFEIWTHGKIANDNSRIARILGCSQDEWMAIRPEIEQFFDLSDGFWRHGRVQKEKTKTDDISEIRREAGRKGAEKRWGEDGKNGKANGKAMLTTPTTTITDQNSPPKSPAGAEQIAEIEAAWNDAAARQGWARCMKMTEKRKTHIRQRIKTYGIDGIRQALAKAETAGMLTGAEPPGWFNIDFLIRSDDSIAKIMEGKYDRALKGDRSSWDFGG